MATSSTPLRLVSLIKKMPKYDKFASDGVTVATADLDRVIGEILPLSYAKRAESVYIGPQRAKIFVAALVIFRTIFRALGEAELTASLKSAQEAIVAELAAEEDTGDAAGRCCRRWKSGAVWVNRQSCPRMSRRRTQPGCCCRQRKNVRRTG